MNTSDVILVGFDNAQGDTAVLTVGRKKPGNVVQPVQILNVFLGKEAEELYRKLVTEKTLRK